MKGIYFSNREGQTELSASEREGIKLSHISNMRELNEAEQVNINSGLLWLKKCKEDILNEEFMRKLHKKLFGDLWSWAGTYRKSEKNIGIDYWEIPVEIIKLCNDTRYWIENESYDWPELQARFHHRLVSIHPFPNGNGRFSRILTNVLCEKNGHASISWGQSLPPEQRREKYIEALQSADMKNLQPLIDFMQLN